jgi:hypothetical protein
VYALEEEKEVVWQTVVACAERQDERHRVVGQSVPVERARVSCIVRVAQLGQETLNADGTGAVERRVQRK